jgi:glycosyltransferase involved in cell wall biosynthesis
MRIAFVTGEYPPDTGGVGDYTRHLAAALAERGHAVSVIATRGRRGEARNEGAAPIDVRTAGVEGVAAVGRIRRLVREIHPDVVSLQYVPQMYGRAGIAPAIALLPFVLHREGARIVCTMHEVASPIVPGPRQLAAALAHRAQALALLTASDAAIVTNGGHGRLARQLRLRGTPLREVPVGASVLPESDGPGASVPRSMLGYGGPLAGDFSPLAVGKRPDDLIALARATTACVRFVMIGGLPADSGQREAFIRRTRAAGAGERFLWTGSLPARGVSRHLSALDVYLHTNAAGATGGSTTLASALAHGVPTIAYASADTPWYMREGGIALVRSGDPEAFASRAAALLGDPAARMRLGEQARRLYARHLSWDVIARQAEEAMS